MKNFLFLLIIGCFVSVAFAQDSERVVRGVVEIGPSSTRVFVAVINKKTNTIEQDLTPPNNSEIADYAGAMKSNHNQISKTVFDQGVQAIKELKTLASEDDSINKKLEELSQRTIDWRGIANSLFLSANNGPTMVENFQFALKFPVELNSTKQEARLIYLAGNDALQNSKVDPVVWDIGSSSQQLVYLKNGFLKVKPIQDQKSLSVDSLPKKFEMIGIIDKLDEKASKNSVEKLPRVKNLMTKYNVNSVTVSRQGLAFGYMLFSPAWAH